MATEVRVTQIIAEAEVEAEAALLVSQLGVYAEVSQDELRVSQLGIYVELEYVAPEEEMATHHPTAGGNRTVHTRLPEEVTGYAFDAEDSWWSVIIPEASENLLEDPSFEYSEDVLDHYFPVFWESETLMTNAAVGATGGRRVLRLEVDPGGANATLTSLDQIQITPGAYTFSLDIYCTHIGWTLEIRMRIDTQLQKRVSIPITRTGWYRYEMTHVFGASGSLSVELASEAINTGSGFIYTDRWQVERKAYSTTYFDGDSVGWNDPRPGYSYFWRGKAGDSTSLRRATTGSGGRIVPLTDYGFQTTAIIGLGMAPVEQINTELDDGSEVPEGVITRARDFTVTGLVGGCAFPELNRKRNELIKLLRPNNTPDQEPLILRYAVRDLAGNVIGDWLDIICAYSAGLEGSWNNLYQETIGIQFHASQPYPREIIDSASDITLYKTLVGNRIVFRDETYDYINLGVGTNSAPAQINDAAFTDLGDPVIVGSFTQIAGDTVSNIATWVDSLGQWLSPPESSGFNDQIRCIETSRNVDGWIGVGGDFTDIEGMQVRRFALADPAGAPWQEPGAGLDGIVYDLTRTIDGMWWVGGAFSAEGDGTNIDLNLVAQYDPDTNTFSDLATGLSGTAVYAVETQNERYVYFGGDFEGSLLGDNVNFIAAWDFVTGGWEELAGGVNGPVHQIFFGPDRSLYITGDFTADYLEQYDLPGMARYTGDSWEPVLPLSDYTSAPEGVKVSVDPEGIFWFYQTNSALFDFTIEVPGVGPTAMFGWRNGVFYPPPFQYTGVDIDTVSVVRFDYAGRMLLILGDESEGNETYVPYLNSIEYVGTADAFPNLTIGGPCNPRSIYKPDDKRGIFFRNSLVLSEFEEMRILLDGFRQRIYSDLRNNMMREVNLGATSFSKFVLHPGTNKISVFARNVGDDSYGYLVWRNRYWSVDAATQL